MSMNVPVKTRIHVSNSVDLFQLAVENQSPEWGLGIECRVWISGTELQTLADQIEVALAEAAQPK